MYPDIGEALSLLNTMYETVETPAMAELNREMSPILAELMTLEPGNYNHPAFKQLFNWLVDQQRTAEEVCYVIGPLQKYVENVMYDSFENYVDGGGYGNMGIVVCGLVPCVCK